jgi:hypothetical protein
VVRTRHLAVRPALTSEQVCRSINLFLFGRLMENVCATVSSPLGAPAATHDARHASTQAAIDSESEFAKAVHGSDSLLHLAATALTPTQAGSQHHAV